MAYLKERIKFQIYEGIRDLGYNIEYDELFVLLELKLKKLKLEHRHENRTDENKQIP